jgi:DNA polymerase I
VLRLLWTVPVLLLDAYNLLFRSFASLPSAITGADDLPINAVYGMLAFIIRAVREQEPEHIVAAFDVPDVPTFRHRLYKQYQAQRGPMGGENAPDFQRQVGIARELLPQLGIPAISRPGFEADDIMGTLAVQLAMAGRDAIAVSTDRDLLQLIRPGVSILVPGKQQTLIESQEAVRARIGVDPEGVTSFKGLAGDASDNIPGLSGIGTKTASALVTQFRDLDGIYGNLGEIAPRQRGILRAGRELAYLYQDVATIRTEVPDVDAAALPPLLVTANSGSRELLKQFG